VLGGGGCTLLREHRRRIRACAAPLIRHDRLCGPSAIGGQSTFRHSFLRIRLILLELSYLAYLHSGGGLGGGKRTLELSPYLLMLKLTTLQYRLNLRRPRRLSRRFRLTSN